VGYCVVLVAGSSVRTLKTPFAASFQAITAGSTSALLSVQPVARRPHRAHVCTVSTPALPHLIKSEGERDRKFADSLLKGTGFETAVPRKAGPVRAPLATRNRKFESTSLQQRICKLSVPLALSGITSRGAVSTKVNRMIAAASNVDPRRFREGPDIIADDFGKDDFGKIARHFGERHLFLSMRSGRVACRTNMTLAKSPGGTASLLNREAPLGRMISSRGSPCGYRRRQARVAAGRGAG
jgi:hypothetical protein